MIKNKNKKLSLLFREKREVGSLKYRFIVPLKLGRNFKRKKEQTNDKKIPPIFDFSRF